MNYNEEKFRNEFGPLHVPANFEPGGSKQDQVVFALAQIGAGSAEDVIVELAKYQSSVDPVPYLQVLFDKGLIRGKMTGGVMHYDLGKITDSNDGET